METLLRWEILLAFGLGVFVGWNLCMLVVGLLIVLRSERKRERREEGGGESSIQSEVEEARGVIRDISKAMKQMGQAFTGNGRGEA